MVYWKAETSPPDKGPYIQGYGLSSSHVQMWELDHKEGCVKELMLLGCGAREDSWESLGLQEIKLVNSKGNQPQIFIERVDAEAEAPIFWPPDANGQLSGKGTDAEKDWRQKEKRATEVEMVG